MSAAPEWLRAEVASLAWCWRLSRRDGVVVALTSHDRDLMIDGLVYRAAPGLRPSALEARDGLDPDTMDLAGGLSDAAVRAEDLAAGRWDNAALMLAVADWTDADARNIVVTRGWIGAVERRDAGFTAELNAGVALLDRPVVPLTSPTCRAALGDRACRVDLAPLTHRVMVVAAGGNGVTIDRAWPDGTLAFGRLRWLDGPLCGLDSLILDQQGSALVLAVPPEGDMGLPVAAEVVEGCDRRAGTCATRFANAANFQGEAWLPGNDLLTRYPGG